MKLVDADVRFADMEWAKAEGFRTVLDFWDVWAVINKLPYYAPLRRVCGDDTEQVRRELLGGGSPLRTGELVSDWLAWKVGFRLKEVYADKVEAWRNQ